MTKKKEHGVFYTRRSPFQREPFLGWLASIPELHTRRLVEPFAGENSIPAMLPDLTNVWIAQDISAPKTNLRPDITVQTGNSFLTYPNCAMRDVVITNPPYLAKNAAMRSGLAYPDADEDDLYKIALREMLDRHEYVAAIIPASFMTAELYDNRIVSVDLMIGKYFDDTDHPTCLALFGPVDQRSWTVWKEGVLIGDINHLRATRDEVIGRREPGIRFNDVNGQISLLGLDKPRNGLIQFGPAHLVANEEIKVSSRARTKIFIEGLADPDKIIYNSNLILNDFREKTGDVFLTPFRGLREDGDFRRRLDFKQAAAIIGKAIRDDKLRSRESE